MGIGKGRSGRTGTGKSVICYSKRLIFIDAVDAANYFGVTRGYINAACAGRKPHVKQYVLDYLTEEHDTDGYFIYNPVSSEKASSLS